MAILLKNLVARSPQREDLLLIAELITLCESTDQSVADGSLEELLFRWQRPDFHPAKDAWVIVTTKGQPVGLACVWPEESARISAFLCVHPGYRNRGIGTLLLRLAEVRARQYALLAPSDERVLLSGLITAANKGAQRLFEHEGYQRGRQFLRISFAQMEEGDAISSSQAQKKLSVDVSIEPGQLLGMTPLTDKDGLCVVSLYRTYEKELRPAPQISVAEEPEIDTCDTLVSMH